MNLLERKPSLHQAQPQEPRPEWSVIVITRNEEEMIGKCLESVLDALDGRSSEVILVDSASSDRTVQIASRYPIRIVQLADDAPRRPAVGRHVGYKLAHGRWLLFMDGDSVLEPNWVGPAHAALETDSRLAGVAGVRLGVLAGTDHPSSVRDEYAGLTSECPSHLGGPALYRREALEEVRGFDPALYCDEELELGCRLRKAGWRLRRLPEVMTLHYRKARSETPRELFRRMGRRFPIGMGQMARRALVFGLPVERPLAQISHHLAFFVLLVCGALTVGATIAGLGSTPLLGWSGLMVVLFLAFVVRARGVRHPAYYFLEWTLASPLVVWGLVRPPRESGAVFQVPVARDFFGEAVVSPSCQRPPTARRAPSPGTRSPAPALNHPARSSA